MGILVEQEDKQEQTKEIEELKNKKETMIFYESPHRIEETIHLLNEVLGNRKVSIARELTKIHEEYIRGNLDEFKDFDFSSIKGEMVVVIEGNKEIKLLTDEDIISLLKDEIDKGSSIKDAIKNISQNYSLKKNYVYQLANSIKK